MRHDDKDFSVYIPFTHVTDEGIDDYQSEEIAKALKEKVASFFDGEVMAIFRLIPHYRCWMK